jgi:hypothetical protein
LPFQSPINAMNWVDFSQEYCTNISSNLSMQHIISTFRVFQWAHCWCEKCSWSKGESTCGW